MGLPLFLSSLFLTVSAWPVAAGEILPGDTHDPIRIESDADLSSMDLLSGNGVRGGTGTASDPYVISRWTIRPDDGEHGVSVKGTRAHLLIDNLTIQTAGDTPDAIFAADTANLHIRNVFIAGSGAGLTVLGSVEAVVERAIIDEGDLRASGNDGLVVAGSQLGHGTIDIHALGRTVVRGNIVAGGDHVGIAVGPTFLTATPSVYHLVVEKNHVGNVETGIRLNGAEQGRACRNMVESVADTGIAVTASGHGDGRFVVCWNHVKTAAGFAMRLDDLEWTLVHNNTLTESAVGLTWGDVTGSIRDNYVTRNNLGFSLAPVPDRPGPRVHRNLVVENDEAARNAYRIAVDLKKNWWGTSQDPRLAGDESETNRIVGPIDMEPWCLDPSCERLSTDVVDVPLGGAWALLSVVLAAVFSRRSRTRRRSSSWPHGNSARGGRSSPAGRRIHAAGPVVAGARNR